MPYMNSNLRKTINVKNMLWRKYKKNVSTENWNRYRAHRNYVTKLRKQSMSTYLTNKCNVSNSGKEFWGAVKPLISTKSMSSNDNIMLLENDEILREPQELCNVFNEYFVNIAKEIGVNDRITLDDSVTSIIIEHDSHPSIDLIRRNHANDSNFQFSDV